MTTAQDHRLRGLAVLAVAGWTLALVLASCWLERRPPPGPAVSCRTPVEALCFSRTFPAAEVRP